jgi:hypothetical protein
VARGPTGRLHARCDLTGPELAMEAGGEFVLESAVAGEVIEWVAYFRYWQILLQKSFRDNKRKL